MPGLIRSPRSRLIVCACAFSIVACQFSWGKTSEFIAGADFSHQRFFEDRGIIYRDGSGVEEEALTLLHERGVNCVRLRLFTSSAEQAEADPYNAINNLDYTIPLAVRVKQAGLQFMLDFHYSDTWADPGKQAKPSAWADLPFVDLEAQVYSYSSNSIAAFRSVGAMPDIVQVGNEIISGFLWPDGRVGGDYDTAAQWAQFGRLLKAAIQGVHDGATESPPPILIHIDRGGDWGATRWFFDNLLEEGVPFDLIGQSYYPFWHGSFTDLRTCLNQTAIRYGKPVIIAETAFPWNDTTSIQGIPPTPEGQVEFVVSLAEILDAVPGNMGAGIIWWGSEYVRLPGYNLAGFDRRSFFDFQGHMLPVVGTLGQTTAPVRIDTRRTSDNLNLSWPLSGAGMTLQTTAELGPTNTWSPSASVPTWNGTEYSVSTPLTNAPQFLRLRGD